MISAELIVKFSDAETARAINESLLPDNINVPEGMKINQVRRGKTLRIEVSLSKEEKEIETMTSTLDEFVSHMQTAVQTLEKIQTVEDRGRV